MIIIEKISNILDVVFYVLDAVAKAIIGLIEDA